MEALSIGERSHLVCYVSEQPPYNLLDRRIENELIPLCQKYGLAVISWSPIKPWMRPTVPCLMRWCIPEM